MNCLHLAVGPDRLVQRYGFMFSKLFYKYVNAIVAIHPGVSQLDGLLSRQRDYSLVFAYSCLIGQCVRTICSSLHWFLYFYVFLFNHSVVMIVIDFIYASVMTSELCERVEIVR